MIRVSTYATQQLSLTQTLNTQSRVQEQQIQVSSGKTARNYAGLSGEARRLLSMEDSLAQTEGFLKNIDAVTQQLTAMETTTSQTQELATRLRTLLVGALSGDTAADLALPDQAQSMLDELSNLLGRQYDGRFLFGGARTDLAPVDFSAFDPLDAAYDPSDPVTANAGYYQGDTTTLAVRIDKQTTLDYGVTAVEPGFENLARALVLAREGGAPGSIDRSTLEQALSLAETASEEIPNIRARIGNSLTALEQTKDRHADTQIYAQQVISDIENVDVAEVMTRLAADQLQLEAAYSVTVRLSRVSLLNFLN